jgi:hypothetical protein
MAIEVETEELLREDIAACARAIVHDLRAAVAGGRDWYSSLLDAVARWPLPQEWVDGRYYRYLIGGEAFDWLLLAERLLETIEDLVSEEDRVALLFRAVRPAGQGEDGFKEAIGPSKYRAHLNYLYGVIVEEALQLSVEEDVQKELRCCALGHDRRVDDSVYQRIYGRSREMLLAQFRMERGLPAASEIALAELHEFTYWLFKFRMHECDRARVASDTRRGLVLLSRMQVGRNPAVAMPDPPEPPGFIDGRVMAQT